MSRFLEINVGKTVIQNQSEVISNVNNQKQFCACCLEETTLLVRILTCKHTSFLEYFTKLKLDPDTTICQKCHNFLRKIELFKKMVETSNIMIAEELNSVGLQNKPVNLKYSKIEIISTINSRELSIKIIDEENLTNQNTYTTNNILGTFVELKCEHLDSDFENDIPLAQYKNCEVETVKIKRKNKSHSAKKKNMTKKIKSEKELHKVKGSLQEKSEGKIRIVDMTADELNAEREQDARREKYVKLPYKCTLCLIGFDFELTLKYHMEKRHASSSSSFVCEICQSVLNSDFSHKEHMKRHLRRYECMACCKRHKSLKAALCHYSEIHDKIVEEFACEECGFVTDSYRRYRYHKEKHRSKPKCEECGNDFSSNSSLRIHMYTVHNRSRRIFKCSMCDKVYRCRSGLAAHESTHASASRAYCDKCNVHFRSVYNLRHHLKTHSNHVTESDKRFVCDECGDKFTTKSSLKIHIGFVHLNTTKHECDKCFKVFKHGSHLRAHKTYVHLKQQRPRNKICDYCGRAFHSLSILRSHVRTHTGERPLQCAHCAATFAHSAARYTHTKLLHSTDLMHTE